MASTASIKYVKLNDRRNGRSKLVLLVRWRTARIRSTHNLFIEVFANGGLIFGSLRGTFFFGSVESDAL